MFKHFFNTFKNNDIKLLAFCTLIFAFLFNIPIFQIYFAHNPVTSIGNVFQLAAFTLFITFLLAAFLVIFTFKYLQKPAYIILFCISASALYFNQQYHVIFDSAMLLNLQQTHFSEAVDFVSLKLIFWLIVLAALPTYLIIKSKLSHPTILGSVIRNSVIFGLCVFLSLLSAFPFYGELSGFVRANDTQLKYSLIPIAPIRSFAKVLKDETSDSDFKKELLDPNAKIGRRTAKPTIAVVIVGETARARGFFDDPLDKQFSNFTKNYADNLIEFKNFTSCATSTAQSLPCMFSTLSRSDFSRSKAMRKENIAELASRVGYDVTWIDNDGGCKGLCDSFKNEVLIESHSELDTSSDLALIDVFKQSIESLIKDKTTQTKKDRLVILHELGSHGPAYYKRTPSNFKLHLPECESNDFSGCDSDEILNSYNNTLIFTKHVFKEIVQTLETLNDQYETFAFYVSDHGESTGESGYFLHGIPYFMAPKEQTHIPALLWLSQSYKQSNQIDFSCLKGLEKQALSHDNFSHSVIDLLNIESNAQSEELSILSQCKKDSKWSNIGS